MRDIVGFVVLALTATLLWVDSTVAREARAEVCVECEDVAGMASLPVLNPWIGQL